MDVKVKAIKRYHDMTLKKIIEKDTEFEVSKARADYLVKQGMVEILKEAKGKEQKDEKEKTV